MILPACAARRSARVVASSGSELLSRAEGYRVELVGHCYRLLGSGFEAEDAVQETLLRAWRNQARYDPRRAALRTWLFSIATRVCLDMLRSAQRRALASDFGPSSRPGAALGAPLPESAWVLPVPDSRVVPVTGDPADIAAQRETIRLAFVAALQLLPPRQRAVLLLRDVLRFSAAEVADQLECSRAAVASALQRARRTLRAADLGGDPLRPEDPVQARLLGRYCDAFERDDVDGLLALLHADARMTMPPFAWWLQGQGAIGAALRAADAPCAGARLVPVEANGSPAFWQTRPTGSAGAHEPFALVVLDVRVSVITGITTFLDLPRLMPLFDFRAGGQPSDESG